MKKILRALIVIPLFVAVSPIGMLIAFLFGNPLDWFRLMADIVED